LNALSYRGPELLAELIERHATTSARPGRVLDVGCGTGLCARFLRPWAERLEGVDLSPAMLARAKDRDVYDDLHCEDLVAFAARHLNSFDLIVAADTLNYFGELEPVFCALAGSLRPGGRLAFFVEQSEAASLNDYVLERHGRYSHRPRYVETCLARIKLTVIAQHEAVIRTESGQPVVGHLFLAEQSSSCLLTPNLARAL
jgi:predicted TPR repeat methyltransferase